MGWVRYIAQSDEQCAPYNWRAKSSNLSFKIVLMQLKLTWLCVLSLEVYLYLAGKVMTWKDQDTLLCWQLPLQFNDNDISGRVGDTRWWLIWDTVLA